MILIKPYNPLPCTIWNSLYHLARHCRGQRKYKRIIYVKAYCDMLETKYNIDSDYLMETMGKYALSIT